MEPIRAILTDELLERIRSRAAGYDAANTFCAEDLIELGEVGYLKALLPLDRGGLGWGMERTTAAQRLLAAHAPATALAVNMHLVWSAVAQLLAARGDERLDFVYDWVAAGEIMAFGVSEAGNDSVLFDSVTRAEPSPEGGYDFTGMKIFTSLAPAWTKLGVFGKEGESDAARLVHGFIDRADPGVETIENWDTLGMRASQSHSTKLTAAHADAETIHSTLPTGPNADPLVFGIFAAFLTLTASVYVGLAERGVELAAERPAKRTSLSHGGRALAQDPDVRWQVADAGLEILRLDAQLRMTARDLDDVVDHGSSWFPRLVTLRTHAGDTARRTVQLALQVSGGGQYFRGSELERLYRDALASLYHPSDAESAHSTVATWLLGPLAD
ncbi:acyl-CoA dehydrogenase family protein [Arthrobacter rhombi]|uniref:acyl-CoA dehydrogenase family protein n=1 Tax=Arthrobacter rhombi TaxID=71253 RepID=UPI0031D08639